MTLDLDVIAQSESVFALSNGHIGWRANLDEGEPYGLPGSYLNGVHELRPLPYAEAGYGYPESDQVLINVTNGKLIRLLVDDEPLDVRTGELTRHERVLDFRDGVLRRELEWASPSHRHVSVASARLVSLAQRSVAAIEYVVSATYEPARVVIQSELIANEPLPHGDTDPRTAFVLDSPWCSLAHSQDGTRCGLVHRTQQSGLTMAVAMDHLIDGPTGTQVAAESSDDLGRVTVSVTLAPWERLRLVKFVAYGWSAARSPESIRDQVDAALAGAVQTGWDGLLAEQRAYLDDFWQLADIELEGDAELQQAARFSLFQVMQAGARAERRAIPAKGLTGTGYDGHTFWDTESFVLPVLTATMPNAAADALAWRYDTLATARERAATLHLAGAAFPWRTITGAECSSYWPAGTAAFHINADIADAVVRYLHSTGDADFERTVGVDLLTWTARLWSSLGHHDDAGRFRIDGVTGPDEYSAVADNNVYTNLMAQRNLGAAADAIERHPERARELDVGADEIAAWRAAAASVVVPYSDALGVHEQSERFTSHQVWDFAGTKPDQYPLLLHFPYFDLYRKQVVKQADLVLAMFRRGDAFSDDQKEANFNYYERVTVRDSSLSACCQAVMAAEVGHLDLAYDYLAESALMDLDDLEHNIRDGLHVASLAGTWISLVGGLGGLRDRGDTVGFAPRLPDGITRLCFGMLFRGRRLRVDASYGSTTYRLADGDPLEIYHYGEPVTVTDAPLVLATPAGAIRVPTAPPPRPPVGREPLRRARRGARSKTAT